jgi:hypothetical protein
MKRRPPTYPGCKNFCFRYQWSGPGVWFAYPAVNKREAPIKYLKGRLLMKKVKKMSIFALTLVLSMSLATGALASNGKDSAPGQSENFHKGITTEVTTSEEVYDKTIYDTEVTDDFEIVPKQKTYEKDPVVTEEVTREEHPSQDWYRYKTTTTTETTTVTETWNEEITTITTKFIETPVTVTKTTVITSEHRGAPGSNGKHLGETSEITIDKVKGEPQVVDTVTDVSSVKTNVNKEENTASASNVSRGDWIRD